MYLCDCASVCVSVCTPLFRLRRHCFRVLEPELMRSLSRCVIGSLEDGGGDWGLLSMPPGEGEVGGGGGGCRGEDRRVNSCRQRS